MNAPGSENHTSLERSSSDIQIAGLLREDIQTAGDVCGRVVDLAVEASNTAFLSSFAAAHYLGLGDTTFLDQDLFFTADTVCAAVLREIQQLLDQELASLSSSYTIDLDAATAEDPSGTAPCSFPVYYSS